MEKLKEERREESQMENDTLNIHSQNDLSGSDSKGLIGNDGMLGLSGLNG